MIVGAAMVRTSAASRGVPFRSRIPDWARLARSEREYCSSAFPALDRYAGRVAARDAVDRVVAAAGIEVGAQYEIVRTARGRPLVRASVGDREHCPSPIEVSIAHRRGIGVAIATAREPLRVGVDLIERRWAADAFDRWGDGLVGRVLTDGERARGEGDPTVALTMGVAAKEALGKVLKRSWPGVSWLDVELERVDDFDRPDAVEQVGAALGAAAGTTTHSYAVARNASTTTPLVGLWVALGVGRDLVAAVAVDVSGSKEHVG